MDQTIERVIFKAPDANPRVLILENPQPAVVDGRDVLVGRELDRSGSAIGGADERAVAVDEILTRTPLAPHARLGYLVPEAMSEQAPRPRAKSAISFSM